MKAEEQKLETNSLAVFLAKAKVFLAGRGGYYAIGTVALIVAVVLLWNYMAKSRKVVSDERILRLEAAGDAKKLKEYMEENAGNIFGSIAKMHLARRHLRGEGLELLGTNKPENRRKAAADISTARAYFLELTKELKEKEEPALLQEAWIGAAQAEEALVGLLKPDSTSEYQGDADKAIEYYGHAVKFFPDTDGTKRLQKHLDNLTKNKTAFVDFQKELYTKREQPPLPPQPKAEEKQPVPMVPVPKPEEKKTEPMVPTPPTLPMVPLPPDPKKEEPKGTTPKPKDDKK